MNWENPGILSLIWLEPIIVALAYYSYRSRKKALDRFIDQDAQKRLAPKLSGGRAAFKTLCLLLAITFFIVALARPRFGVYYEQVQRRGADMFILLDVSKSMDAQDVMPSRLEKAKADCLDLLKELKGERVGLIVFAGKPLLKVPLTTDQGFFKRTLKDIDTQSAPRGGTLMGDAIRLAMESMPERTDRDQAMLLITDGEDHESLPVEAATAAAAKKMRVFTMSIGDAKEGARIPVVEGRNKSYLKDKNGQEVFSKADEGLLQQIALAGSGVYIPAGTKTYDLGQVYKDTLSKLKHGTDGVEERIRYREQYQWFLAAGMFFLIVYVLINEKHVARNEKQETNYERREVRNENRHSALSSPMTLILLFVLLISPQALQAETVPTMASAQSDYQTGHFTQAAEKYQKIIDSMTSQKNPNAQKKDLTICQYNLARSLDKAGQFEKAKDAYLAVAGSADDAMALRAKYDLGCLYAQIANQESGSDPKAVEDSVRKKIRSNVNRAAEQFRAVLDAQPDYPDAKEKLERILTVSREWEDAWKDADLKKDAEKKTALQYAVDVEEDLLKAKAKSSRLGLKDDSLVTRQEYFQTAEQLSDSIKKAELLQDKTFKALSGQEAAAAQAQPGQPAPQAPVLTPEQQAQLDQVKPVIEQWVKDSQSAIEQSADKLYSKDSKGAADSLSKCVQTIDNLYLVMSPLQEMITRAIKEQKELIKYTEKEIKKKENASKKEADAEKTEKQNASSSDEKLLQIERDENVFKQKAILPWTQTIVPKAEAMLQQLPPEKAPKKGDGSSKLKLQDNAENLQDALDALQNPEDAAVDPNSANPQDQQVQKMRNMCKKAVELGPSIPPLVQYAANDLKASKLEDALTSQKEALRLLEEIIKDDSQQNQDNQDQQNQDQQNQDQQNQDQQNKDQQSKDKQNQNKDQQNQDKQDQQDQQDQDKQDQDKQDQQNQDEQKQDEQDESEQDKKSEEEEQKDNQEGQQDEQEAQQDEQEGQQDEQEAQQQEAQQAQQNDEELTDAQARGLMRRVQARQDERKKLEAQLRKLLNPPDKVEKDW